jgi:hypothetical protein
MANDPNKSGKGAPNTLSDSGFADIESVGRRSSRHTAEDIAQRVRLSQSRQRVNTYEEALASGADGPTRDLINQGLSHERKMVNSLEPRIELRAESQRQRFTSMTQSVIERNFASSSVNGQSAEFARSSVGQRMGIGMMGTPYEQLEAKRMSMMNSISSLGSRAGQIAEDLYDINGKQDPAKMQQLQQIFSQRNRMVNRMGSIDAAQRLQRAEGIDPESRAKDLLGVGERAARVNFRESVSNDLRSGSMSNQSVEQLKQREVQLAGQLTEELEKLKNAAGKSAEEIDSMQKAAGKTADEFKRTQEAIGQGGGSKGGGFGKYAGILEGAGQFGREVFLNQTNTITGNSTTAAGMTNSLFDRRRAALAGDMTQLSLLSSGVFSGAQKEGAVNKGTSSVTDILSGAGGLAGGLMAAGAASSATGVGAPLGLGLLAAGGVVYGASKLINVARGADSNSEKLAEEQRQIRLAEEVAHVPGAMRQRLYDFGMGARGAALEGGGSAGQRYLDMYTGKGSDLRLQRMQEARIGTEQMNQYSAQGFAEQGSVFNSEQVYAARNLERSGMGSMAANMGRMGQLAAAGSNNPQAGLQQVLEAAFMKSLDSAKTLNMMVQYTSAMAASSVGASRAGMDTVGSSARILSNLVNPDMANKEMAMSRAATAADTLNKINSGVGVNFADMAGTSAIAKAGGVGMMGAINLKKLDDTTAETLRAELSRIEKLDPQTKIKESKRFGQTITETMGLSQFVDKDGQVRSKDLSKGLDARSKGIFRHGNFIGSIDQTAPGYDDLINKKIGLEELRNNPKYNQLYRSASDAASLTGLTLSEAMTRGEGAKIGGMAGAKAEGAITGKGIISETQKTLDDLATRQFAEMTKEARLAAKELGGVSEALMKINEASKALGDKLSDKTSDKVMGAATEAAKSFEMGAETFTAGVQQFGMLVNGLSRGMGIRTPGPDLRKK